MRKKHKTEARGLNRGLKKSASLSCFEAIIQQTMTSAGIITMHIVYIVLFIHFNRLWKLFVFFCLFILSIYLFILIFAVILYRHR